MATTQALRTGAKSATSRVLRAELGTNAASRSNVRQWVHRYGPPEAFATAAALVATFTAHAVMGNAVAAAYAATIVEGVVFYGIIFVRDLASRRACGRQDPAEGLRVLRGMAIEFGGAELLDLLLLRPFLLVAGFALAGPSGAFAGKIAADLAFYAPVVAVRELRVARRWYV